MFKLKDGYQPRDIGFIKKDMDWVYQKSIGHVCRILFKMYLGSPYIRCSRTGYVAEEQLKLIYDWTKAGYIEWEDC